MAVARSRVRPSRAPRRRRRPLVALGLLVALVGLTLVAAAAVHHYRKYRDYADKVKLVRGMRLLDELVPIACDYFYTGKDKKGPLPDEVWAPFKKYAQEDGDLFDAVITLSRGSEDEYSDACFYKEGKSVDGQSVRRRMLWNTGHRYFEKHYGEPGPGPNPQMACVQVARGEVIIGRGSRPVIFFRRPILVPGKGTIQWHGRAVIILYGDVPSPDPYRSAPAPPGEPSGPPQPETGPVKNE